MTTAKTRVYKDRNGWTAESRMEMPPATIAEPPYRSRPLRLDITTSKGTSGSIVTYARVVEPTPDGFTFDMCGDFHKRVWSGKGRATEGAIATAHAEAMRTIKSTLDLAMIHYFGANTTT